MQEVAATGRDHGQPQLIAGLNGIAIPQAAAWLDHRLDAVAGGQADGIIERKETVTGQHRPPGRLTGGLHRDAG